MRTSLLTCGSSTHVHLMWLVMCIMSAVQVYQNFKKEARHPSCTLKGHINSSIKSTRAEEAHQESGV